MFLTRFLHNLLSWNWSNAFARLQKITAYLPLFLVPWIFSPISSNPFYVEKVLSILVFSSLSIFFYSAKYFFYRKENAKLNKKNINYQRNISPTENNNSIVFKTNPLQKISIIVFIWFLVSQIFSINFNQSFWGVGTLLIFSLLVFSFAIHQVYDKKLVSAVLLVGIGFLAATNMLVVITRFVGSDLLEIVNIKSFSANGDILSLIFILFVGIYLALFNKNEITKIEDEIIKQKISSVQGKKKHSSKTEFFLNVLNQLKTISLFIILFAYVFYAYFLNIYLVAYAFLVIILVLKFVSKDVFQKIINSFKTLLKKIRLKRLKSQASTQKMIKKSKDKKVKIDGQNKLEKMSVNIITSITLTIVAILLGVFEIFLQKDFITPSRDFLPINFSWQILFRSVTDNIKNFSFGVGSNNFSYTFLHFKPDGINQSAYWGNTYSAANQSIFEILSALGVLVPIIFLIYFLVKYFQNKKSYKTKINHSKLIIFLLIIILFLITPLTVASVSVLFFLLVIQFTVVKTHELTLLNSILTDADDKNKHKIKSDNVIRSFLFPIVSIFILITIVFSSYFYISSTLVKLGYFQKSITKTSDGVSLFPYYPDTLVTALSLSRVISVDQQNLNSNYFSVFSNKIINQNPYDPQSYVAYTNYLNLNDANLASSVEQYLKLISLAPNHIPFYLNLSDVLVKQSRYTDAAQVLDKALSMSPNLDISLIKRANVYYLLADIISAESYIKKIKEVSRNQFILAAADELQQKIDSLNSSKK